MQTIKGIHATVIKCGRFWRWHYMRDGVYHRESLRVTTEQQARYLLAERDRQIESGVVFGPSARRPSVLEALSGYESHCRHLRRSTWEMYSVTLRKLADGRKFLDEIDKAVIEKILNTKQRPATIQKNYRTCRAFFRWAVKAKLATENPCDGIRLPKIEQRLCRYLEPAEVKKVLAEADRRRNGILVWLCYYAGLRISEAFHLRAEDIDWRTKTLRVRGWGEWSPKTHAERALPLHPALAKRIKRHGVTAGALAVSDVARQKPERKGEPFNRSAAQALICVIAEKTGIDFGWHDLRHTFAERLLRSGASLFQVSRLLGHASIATTEQAYGWLATEKTDLTDAL